MKRWDFPDGERGAQQILSPKTTIKLDKIVKTTVRHETNQTGKKLRSVYSSKPTETWQEKCENYFVLAWGCSHCPFNSIGRVELPG